jgi:hypothetical protein
VAERLIVLGRVDIGEYRAAAALSRHGRDGHERRIADSRWAP